METWIWVYPFWKGRKRHGEVDFSDPKVGPFKARLIAEGRIERKGYEKKKKDGDK